MTHPSTTSADTGGARRSVGPDDASSILTPLGPGGRPFARWRGVVALMTLVAVAGVVALMLSARAPTVIADVSDRVADRIDQRAPEVRGRAQETLQRNGVDEKDTLAHIGLWAGATLLAGLASWSWRSLLGVVVIVAVGSTALELAQQSLAPSRITEWRDVGANAMGITLGALTVVALTSVSGFPARMRRRRRGRVPPDMRRPAKRSHPRNNLG